MYLSHVFYHLASNIEPKLPSLKIYHEPYYLTKHSHRSKFRTPRDFNKHLQRHQSPPISPLPNISPITTLRRAQRTGNPICCVKPRQPRRTLTCNNEDARVDTASRCLTPCHTRWWIRRVERPRHGYTGWKSDSVRVHTMAFQRVIEREGSFRVHEL